MKKLQKTFSPEFNNEIEFWFMRQAGRYLPEYRALREDTGDFLTMCYCPEKASEVTIQPLRRFDMSAAIIFSDILVIPHALGIDVQFIKGEGPKLEVIKDVEKIKEFNREKFTEFLTPVYEAISQTRKQLDDEKSLIGFAGAPWTIACYMLQGKGGKEFTVAREKIYSQPHIVEAVINVLKESIAEHLINQIEAGVDVLQIFDSWAAYVPETHREALIYNPTAYIVKKVKEKYPEVPIIGFPKGLGYLANEYVAKTNVDGFGVDMCSSIEQVRESLPDDIVVQGNLDPLLLASSKEKTLQRAKEILDAMNGKRFIFNLGHGMVPHTPIENVLALSDLIKNYR